MGFFPSKATSSSKNTSSKAPASTPQKTAPKSVDAAIKASANYKGSKYTSGGKSYEAPKEKNALAPKTTGNAFADKKQQRDVNAMVSSGTKMLPRGQKADTTAYEKRLANLSQWEKNAAKRSERAEEPFRAIPLLKGDNWAQKTARDLLAAPARYTVGAGEQVMIAGAKVAMLADAARHIGAKETAKQALQATKDVPKAMLQTLSPITKEDGKLSYNPEGAVNLALIGAGIKKIGAAKEVSRMTPKGEVTDIRIKEMHDISKTESTGQSKITVSDKPKPMKSEVKSVIEYDVKQGKGKPVTIKETTFQDGAVIKRYEYKGNKYEIKKPANTNKATIKETTPKGQTKVKKVELIERHFKGKNAHEKATVTKKPETILQEKKKIIQARGQQRIIGIKGKIGKKAYEGEIVQNIKQLTKQQVEKPITTKEQSVIIQTDEKGARIVGRTQPKVTSTEPRLVLADKPSTERVISKNELRELVRMKEMRGEYKDIPIEKSIQEVKSTITERPEVKTDVLTTETTRGELSKVQNKSLYQKMKESLKERRAEVKESKQTKKEIKQATKEHQQKQRAKEREHKEHHESKGRQETVQETKQLQDAVEVKRLETGKIEVKPINGFSLHEVAGRLVLIPPILSKKLAGATDTQQRTKALTDTKPDVIVTTPEAIIQQVTTPPAPVPETVPTTPPTTPPIVPIPIPVDMAALSQLPNPFMYMKGLQGSDSGTTGRHDVRGMILKHEQDPWKRLTGKATYSKKMNKELAKLYGGLYV